MKGNVTGGILLLTLGALIIGAGVTEKGKQILNILTNGSGENPDEALSKERESLKKQLDDKTNEKKSSGGREPDGNFYGFAGEKGAIALG